MFRPQEYTARRKTQRRGARTQKIIKCFRPVSLRPCVKIVGCESLDIARFLFGDASALYCRTARIHADIKGEDMATVVLSMKSGATVTCDLSFATRREDERFPQTFVKIEGERGSLELASDYWIRETTADGTHAVRHEPPRYTWADPAYAVVHAGIVLAQTNIARALKGLEVGETSGEDNLKTMELVFRSYESAASGQVIAV